LIFELKAYIAEEEAKKVWEINSATLKGTVAIALAVSLLVIFFTHRAITRPVNELIEGTKTLASGDLSKRIDLKASGEFRELAESFNRMTDALRSHQERLIEAERLATVGRLAAGVAHEINNPIAVILGYARMVGSRLAEGASEKEALKAIEEEAKQCKDIVESLLSLSRPPTTGVGEVINPKELVADVLSLAHVLQLTERVSIQSSVIDEPIPLTLSRLRLRQVVLNLVTNALEALQGAEAGEVRIEGSVADVPAQAHAGPAQSQAAGARSLVLRFADNGPGIPKENVRRIFEPFFTTKRAGTGLGLAIAHSIVSGAGGRIEVDTSEGKGVIFVVRLPIETLATLNPRDEAACL
jgi:signal transduction histidine kinase